MTNKDINLSTIPDPLLWKMLEDDEINKPSDPEIYLEVRGAIEDALTKLKRGKRVDVFGGCVGMDKDGNADEFILGFGYKGMVVSMKGMIGNPNGGEAE
jgi:hypothetical protein